IARRSPTGNILACAIRLGAKIKRKEYNWDFTGWVKAGPVKKGTHLLRRWTACRLRRVRPPWALHILHLLDVLDSLSSLNTPPKLLFPTSGLLTIRSEAVGPIGPWSIALNFAGEVRSVVGAAAAFIDSLLRVWAKGASHVDDATFVDSGGGDRFWGLVLFAPAFECSELIELIGAGPSPALIHPGDHKKTKPV